MQPPADEKTFIQSFREERTKTRLEEIAYYDSIIESSTSSEIEKNFANEAKKDLIKNQEKETCLENLIRLEGVEDCLVSLASEQVSVYLQTSNTSVETLSKIASLVQTQLNINLSNIKIIYVE